MIFCLFLCGDKDSNKRARNMKLASIFFTASADYLRKKQKAAHAQPSYMLYGIVYYLL